jgi:restriction system protein
MTMAQSYYRIMLGRKSIHAKECFDGAFIGGDWGMDFDLNGKLPENWRDFNKEFIPAFLERNPEKSKVAAGLACGMLHTICKGIDIGDIVLCPNGSGAYYVGEMIDAYSYVPNSILPHRRHVQWYPKTIYRAEMSQGLQNSAGSIGTVSNITKHGKEISGLLAGNAPPQLISTDELVEDPTVFALEKHLEDFLVRNWSSTELGKKYDIVEEDGEIIGQQYPSDTGPIDILAISKDKKEYLVVELKKGRASDAVVGQIQRYMGYVLEDLSEPDQTVRGVIVALEDDLRLKRALQVTSNIDFYKYQVSFKLFKS